MAASGSILRPSACSRVCEVRWYVLGLSSAGWRCVAFGRVVHKNPVITGEVCRASSGEHPLALWVKGMAEVGFSPSLNHFFNSR